MRRAALMLTLVMFTGALAGYTNAATPVATPAAKPTATSGAVKITADKFVVDDTAHFATFTGQVVVTRDNLTVWAPKVVVDYGDGGPSNIKSFTASGGVRIKTGPQEAKGDRAVYDPTKQELRLIGNVVITSAEGTLAGPDLVIDLKNNVATFSGGKAGRVTGVFSPQ